MGPGDPFAAPAGLGQDPAVPPSATTAVPRRMAPVHARQPRAAPPTWVIPVGAAAGALIGLVAFFGGALAALVVVVMAGAGALVASLGYHGMTTGLRPRAAWRTLLGDVDDP